MTAFTVNVAVGHFFLGGVADGHDFHLEVQTLASQRVVAVDSNVIAIQIADSDDLHLAVRRGSVELHAHFQLVDTFEHAAAQGADQFGGVFTVGIFRFYGNGQLITNLFAFQSLFQARDNVTCALQVDQRRAAGGAVDDLTSVVGQGIVNGDSLVGGDRHGARPFAEE